jgi:hypothetical protein
MSSNINRCFNSVDKTIINASDLIHSKRQKTIYMGLSENTNSAAGPNPIKLNGRTYNDNFIVKGGTEDNACLASAKSYELLLDLAKGKQFTNPVLDGGSVSINELLFGNVLEIDYSGNNITPVIVDASSNEMTYAAGCGASEYTIDPFQNMFYPSCDTSFIQSVSDVTFRETNYYWKAINAQPLNGMRYPAPLRIGPQETDTTTTTYGNYAPAPISDTVYDDWCDGKHAIK